MALEQIGYGSEDGMYLAGNNAGKPAPIGSDQAVDGLVGIRAGTGKLYYASAASGDTGLRGSTGIIGLVGSQGVTGVIGIQGTQGNTGVIGVTGETGIQGTQGDTGVIGVIGATGIQGIQGSTTDPWSISATLGSIAGWDSTTGVYCVLSNGRTGILSAYFNA